MNRLANPDEYACAALSCLGCPDCTEFVQLFAFGGNNFIQGAVEKGKEISQVGQAGAAGAGA